MLVREITIHHSASSRDKTTLTDTDFWHRARGFNKSSIGFYVGYHFLITGDGSIHQTRRENEIGCHCIPNEGKIGICLTGDFTTETPTPNQLDSLGELLGNIKEDYKLKDEDIFAHCEKARTLCPGKNMMLWINRYRQVSLLRKLILKLQELIKVGHK